jgi:CPA2 family monovalent cation:H+ antiporter-2
MGPVVFYILIKYLFSPAVSFTLVLTNLFPQKKLHKQYHKIEVISENLTIEKRKIDRRYANHLGTVSMSTFTISKESNLAGQTLREVSIRELLGVNIAFIKRGEIMIQVPSKTERLFPGDDLRYWF